MSAASDILSTALDKSGPASRAGLTSVPCWIRDLDDATAYMALALNNAQGELSPIERGMHALHSGMAGKTYAGSIGRPQPSIAREISAARVAESVTDVGYDIADKFSQLVEIHAAPEWLWSALVSALIAEDWTVEATRKSVTAASAKGRTVMVPSSLDQHREHFALFAVSASCGDIPATEFRRTLRADRPVLSKAKLAKGETRVLQSIVRLSVSLATALNHPALTKLRNTMQASLSV